MATRSAAHLAAASAEQPEFASNFLTGGRFRRWPVGIALALTVGACVPPHYVETPYAAQDESMTVPLEWRPTDELRDLEGRPVPRGPWHALRIDPFFDRRPNPQIIGENVQHARHFAIVTAGQVGPFVAAGVRRVLTAQDMRVDAPEAQRILRGEVMQFQVREDNTYNADVVLHVQVQAQGGRVLWDGSAVGHSKRWGRSMSADNYAEAYGNAVVEAAKNLFVDRGFQAAVALGEPPPLPDASVPPPPPPPTP